MTMHITIVGAGAMGSLFGAKLSVAARVTLLDPWIEHVRAVQDHGLTIVGLDGSEMNLPMTATSDPDTVSEADLGIIFVKSHATQEASQWVSRFLADDGLALTLQNGVGNADTISHVLGRDRAVAGVTSHGATLLGPGRVRHAGQGPTHLGTRPEVADRLSRVVRILREAGFEVHISENLESLVWSKLLINVGINPLTAILRVPNGELLNIPSARVLMSRAVAEAEAVCRAKGIELTYSDPLARVEDVARATAANRSSMLQDVVRGAPTEIEVINGAVVEEGHRTGVDTPVNSCLAELVRALEDSYQVRVDAPG